MALPLGSSEDFPNQSPADSSALLEHVYTVQEDTTLALDVPGHHLYGHSLGKAKGSVTQMGHHNFKSGFSPSLQVTAPALDQDGVMVVTMPTRANFEQVRWLHAPP
ncbi:MAG TPA: hypothetical protein DCM14_09010 [Clostridiales bacterium UBA8153]|nr:hypothetical protein [Clostridiales bacterium UBA8153]